MPRLFRPRFMLGRKEWHKRYDTTRGGSNDRGYGADWRRVREQYLRAHPLCEDCSSDLTPIIATLVHHKIEVEKDPEQRLVWSNLVGLCDSCHAKRHSH